MKAIHFISGTPRSGSTLLSALLRQNPEFHAGISSPALAMVNALHATMGAGQEWAPLISDEQRAATMRSVVHAYYQSIGKGRVVFDTSRGWCARMPVLAQLFPDSRVIACVREYSWIIDSFERMVTKNPLTSSKLFNLESSITLYARAEALAGMNGTVGFPWHALREAVYGEHAARLIVLDYEALTREPARTMAFLYSTLGMSPFKHDFDNVEFDDAEEFDAHLGAPGLHRVRRKVQYIERNTILPPELFYRFRSNDFWKTQEFSRLGIASCVLPRS